MKLLIVFLGPQGSGKTTQALLLQIMLTKLGYRTIVTEGIHYTILLRLWHKFAALLTGRKIRYKFRSENIIEEFIEPNMLKRLSPIDFLINVLSAAVSSLKIRLLSIVYPVVIEHEGFVYSQLVYLSFIYRKHMNIRDLLNKYAILLTLIPKKRLIIVLDIAKLRYTDLYVRYRKRQSLTEPWYYIKYQMILYKALARLERFKSIILDATMDMNSLSKVITTFVLQNLRRGDNSE